MGKSYAAFLVRCWRLADDTHRLEVEHIASGERRRFTDAAAALDWICAQAEEAGDRAPDAAGGTGPVRGDGAKGGYRD